MHVSVGMAIGMGFPGSTAAICTLQQTRMWVLDAEFLGACPRGVLVKLEYYLLLFATHTLHI